MPVFKYWKDANMIWEPANYSGLNSIVVPADQVWVPDVHLLNRFVSS